MAQKMANGVIIRQAQKRRAGGQWVLSGPAAVLRAHIWSRCVAGGGYTSAPLSIAESEMECTYGPC